METIVTGKCGLPLFSFWVQSFSMFLFTGGLKYVLSCQCCVLGFAVEGQVVLSKSFSAPGTPCWRNDMKTRFLLSRYQTALWNHKEGPRYEGRIEIVTVEQGIQTPSIHSLWSLKGMLISENCIHSWKVEVLSTPSGCILQQIKGE